MVKHINTILIGLTIKEKIFFFTCGVILLLVMHQIPFINTFLSPQKFFSILFVWFLIVFRIIPGLWFVITLLILAFFFTLFERTEQANTVGEVVFFVILFTSIIRIMIFFRTESNA